MESISEQQQNNSQLEMESSCHQSCLCDYEKFENMHERQVNMNTNKHEQKYREEWAAEVLTFTHVHVILILHTTTLNCCDPSRGGGIMRFTG